ncbi:MAG TPA: serine hydrolase domain-containing protein [Pyrinomonadaceae bacterium]|nr:serine hydrolase domain-containing protein [Pyrinomonadaceae bacterium]
MRKVSAIINASLSATLFVACLTVAASAQGQRPAAAAVATAQQQSPATRRVEELVQVINSTDASATKKFIQETYGGQFAQMPLAAHLNFIAQLRDRTRGIEFRGIQDGNATEATALVRAKLTGDLMGLFVRVEADAPHRIIGIGMRPPKANAGSEGATAAARKLTDAERARELEAYVQKLADADVFSGAVLLAKDGKVLFEKAYGEASKDFKVANRVDTKFNLGSMNKMFTSVAIAQLVERGKLSFDDPLSKFLPEFPSKEAAQKIKIKHLLTHTSGLGSYFNKKFMESSRARFRTVNEMMTLAEGETLAFEPGTKWAYSNTGMLVLGAVIEKVTGQSYFDYVRENIYKPAGMMNTDAYELDLVTPNLAVGYQKEYEEDGRVRFRNNIFQHVIRGGPAGGGYSTVEDLLKFDMALRANKLVGAEYVRQLLSPKPDLNSPQYGYGFGVDTERRIAGHSGGFAGISSNLDMFLDSGYTAIVMSNYGGGSQSVTRKMQELILAGQETRAAKQ